MQCVCKLIHAEDYREQFTKERNCLSRSIFYFCFRSYLKKFPETPHIPHVQPNQSPCSFTPLILVLPSEATEKKYHSKDLVSRIPFNTLFIPAVNDLLQLPVQNWMQNFKV